MAPVIRSDRGEKTVCQDLTTLTSLQRGCEAGAQLDPLVGVMAELGKIVPRFSRSTGAFHLRFPKDKRVQKPLQEVYSKFIESHLFIISYLKKVDPRESTLPSISEVEAHTH